MTASAGLPEAALVPFPGGAVLGVLGEVPSERQSRFQASAAGAASCAPLLLARWDGGGMDRGPPCG